VEPESLARLNKRLDRAKLHLDVLRAEIEAFLRDNRYEVASKFVRDATDYPGTPIEGYYSFTISSRPIPPSEDWAQLIGDCVHNLRSTLDHLVCALARSRKPGVTCSNAEFPVCETSECWDATSTRNKIRGVPPAAKEWIKRHQPYQWGYERTDRQPATFRDNWLWMLNELSNWDKHRAIHTVAWNNAGVSTSGGVGLPIPMNGDTDINTEVARLLDTEYNPNARVEAHLVPQIQFDRSGPCAGLPVDYYLSEFHRRIREMVEACRQWLA
jgi:hypothetical protein